MVAAMIVTVTGAGSCSCQGADAAHENDIISPVRDLRSVFGEWGPLAGGRREVFATRHRPFQSRKTELGNSLRRDVAAMLAMLSISVKAGHQPFGERSKCQNLTYFQ